MLLSCKMKQGESTYPERVVTKNKNLKLLQILNIIWDLCQLVGSKVQLHHVCPCSHIYEETNII